MMKVIFLDYDGVIQTVRSKYKPDVECIRNLNTITDATGARIVVSSTWRREGLKACRQRLKAMGVTVMVIGTTPDLSRDSNGVLVSVKRGVEIGQWMTVYRGMLEASVILDDDKDMGWLAKHLIQTNPHVGLTSDDASAAIRRLTEETKP